MTHERIDALVAEKILGYTFWQSYANNGIREVEAVPPGGERDEPDAVQVDHSAWRGAWTIGSIPHPSTNIAHAFEVVEAMTKGQNRKVAIEFGCFAGRGDTADVVFSMRSDVTSQPGEATARTVPLAICMAALRALGVDTGGLK